MVISESIRRFRSGDLIRGGGVCSNTPNGQPMGSKRIEGVQRGDKEAERKR